MTAVAHRPEPVGDQESRCAGALLDFDPAHCPGDRMALFLDVDGTLIEFAPRPDEVRVPADLPAVLAHAEQALGGALALLSGRSIADLDRLTAPLRLRAIGLHGAECRADPNLPATSSRAKLPATMLAGIRALLAAFPGAWLEDKGPSAAVHYREMPALAPELGVALARHVDRAARDGSSPELDLMAGELVYEIKQAGFDKGSALSFFMTLAPFAGRRPVFVTDHAIDQAGLTAAASLGGCGLSVGGKLPGTAGWFRDPAAVRAWLRELT